MSPVAIDSVAVEGFAAVAAGILIFGGSVFFLMSLVMGAKLAYFVTASIALSFLLIMSIIWSVNPLGPVGKMPEWDQLSIGQSASELEGPSASSYPDAPWKEVDENDLQQTTESAELQTSSGDYLAAKVQDQKLPQSTSTYTADSKSARFLEQGGDLYGGVTLIDPAGKGKPVVVVMQFDPGNPLGTARKVAVGVFLLFVLHLFGLAFVERRARRVRQQAATT